MTKPMTDKALLNDVLGHDSDLLARLVALAQRITLDPVTQVLCIRNGKSQIELHNDGTVRIKGTSIAQLSETDITLNGAWIDLN